MPPNPSMAAFSKGAEVMEHFFGKECLNRAGKLEVEGFDLCKGLITSSWLRQNTKGRRQMPKIEKAEQEFQSIRKEILEGNGGDTPKEKADAIKKWGLQFVEYRKVFEWMASDMEILSLDDYQSEIEKVIEISKMGKGEHYPIT